jgi:hypothetical protein
MEDLKILENDFDGLGAMSMPDSPSAQAWTAAEIKGRFDSLIKALVMERFNALIGALVSAGAGGGALSGAEQIGSAPIAEVSGATVYAQISNLKAQLTQAVQAGFGEGDVTDSMLSETGIKARFAQHLEDILMHIGNAGTTSGTGGAYTAAIETFNPDAAVGLFVLRAHANGVDNATLNINGIGARNIVTNGTMNMKGAHIRQNGTYLFMYQKDVGVFYLLTPEQTSLHTHAIADVVSLQTGLGSKAASAHTHPIDSATNGIIGLQAALNAKQSTIGGAASTITGTNLTANRVLVANSSGKVAVSAVAAGDLRAIKFGASQPPMAVGDVWLKDLGKV